MNPVSRRNFLKGGAAVAGASMIGFPQLFGMSSVFAQDGGGDDAQTIINLAATAETFACVHYYTAISSADALGLSAEEVKWLKNFLDAELKHKQFLEANGAKAVATEFFVPANLFKDRKLFLDTSNTAENWFVAAYLAGIRRFAELNQPLLAATSAQVMGTEAEHQALLRLMNGLQPSFQVLKEPLFWNTSDVVPFFEPFLKGADGFVGPAAFPGDDKIAALVGSDTVATVTPFISLSGKGTAAMMAEMTPEAAMMTGACTISGDNANIRKTPDTAAETSGSLTKGTPDAISSDHTAP